MGGCLGRFGSLCNRRRFALLGILGCLGGFCRRRLLRLGCGGLCRCHCLFFGLRLGLHLRLGSFGRLCLRLRLLFFLRGLLFGRNVGLPFQIVADVADLVFARQRIEQDVEFRRFERFLNRDLLSALCEHIAKILAFQPEVLRQLVDFELCFVISHISS